MKNTDTIKLLRECDAGSKMAVSSIDDVLEKAQDSRLGSLLSESKRLHAELGDQIHALLTDYACDDKDPPAMAKSMARLKTSLKMGIHESDATIAELITDGCNMGIKSLHQYLNQYEAANQSAKSLCKNLISLEDRLRADLTAYL